MNVWTAKSTIKTLLGAALLAAASAAQAVTVDFTSQAWKDAVGSNKQQATVGDVTIQNLTAGSGYNLTFNGKTLERAGCQAGQSAHGLACLGDGIGISKKGSDDEITQGGYEILKVTFFNPVNILGVDFLDLFGNEKTGETAMMTDSTGATFAFMATPGNNLNGVDVDGGYWASGYTGTKISSLTFFGKKDSFSDYSLARVSYKAVTVPEIDSSKAALALGLLLACMGIMFERRSQRILGQLGRA